MKGLLLLCLLCISLAVSAQSTDTSHATIIDKTIQASGTISEKSLHFIDTKYIKLTNTVQKQSLKLLARIQKKEEKLKRKTALKDTVLAQELFTASKDKYQELSNKLHAATDKNVAHRLKEYIPGLDSLQTSLAFLTKNNALQNLSESKLKEIGGITDKLKELEGRMQQANEIQSFIRQREQELKDRLSGLGLGKQILSVNKEVYYYQQRLAEYKSLLNDRKKLEAKAIAMVRDLPAFKDFMQKHSYLSQLFPTPDNYGTSEALAGLQTRQQVQTMVAQRAGGNTGSDPQAYIQQQVQAAQGQLNQLKDKINKLGGGNSDMTMPDFKPNNQKTKTFLQRIEYGVNIQSQKGSNFLPVTSDIGLTAGYKISDKQTMGVGIAYKLGWGSGWKHIKFSNEGISLRSYADIKAKGSIWISGGFEYNYMQSFSKLTEIENLDIWQKSALLGLTQKYKIGKKEGKMQLLFDFLAHEQVPKTQLIKFRVGYSL